MMEGEDVGMKEKQNIKYILITKLNSENILIILIFSL